MTLSLHLVLLTCLSASCLLASSTVTRLPGKITFTYQLFVSMVASSADLSAQHDIVAGCDAGCKWKSLSSVLVDGTYLFFPTPILTVLSSGNRDAKSLYQSSVFSVSYHLNKKANGVDRNCIDQLNYVGNDCIGINNSVLTVKETFLMVKSQDFRFGWST